MTTDDLHARIAELERRVTAIERGEKPAVEVRRLEREPLSMSPGEVRRRREIRERKNADLRARGLDHLCKEG